MMEKIILYQQQESVMKAWYGHTKQYRHAAQLCSGIYLHDYVWSTFTDMQEHDEPEYKIVLLCN